MKIYDTHAHYNDDKYNDDREQLFQKMYNDGVSKINLIGANIDDSIEEKNIAIQYANRNDVPKFYYTVGDHPDEILNVSPNSEKGIIHLSKMKNICKNDDGKVMAVAIGEIGLDYYGDKKNEIIYDNQKKWFIAELELAKKLNLPVVIHSRDACKDTFDIIKEYAKGLRGVIHCFAYEKEIAREYAKIGFMIGIGGTLTFKNNRKTKEVVEDLPLEYIITETDSPWLAPTPFRGKRNESTYIKYIIEEIAKIKNIDVDKVANILYDNGTSLFKCS